MQAVIMAGGEGTRLAAYTQNLVPKPMAAVAGKPILQWQIETLRENGIRDFILVVGFLGDVITEYFGDGKAFGVHIQYFHEKTPLGTVGALRLIKPMLQEGQAFFLGFGDIVFNICLDRMVGFHQNTNALATLFVHPNAHPFDSDLIVKASGNRIQRIMKKGEPSTGWQDNCTNAGLYILDPFLCDLVPEGKADLEKDLLLPLIAKGGPVYAYQSSEYVKDVGTVDRIEQAARDIEAGIVRARNLSNPQKAVFLDRDGTINIYRGLIYQEEQFELEPFAAEAIRLINQSGYLAIVITNQPCVARGLCDISDIERIHRKMQTLLGREGAYLDDILFCPHHPDKGYPEENAAYKIPCTCRKPSTGMVDVCIRKYNIDPAASWFVGDSTIDIQTGMNAGLHTALVLTGEAGNDIKYQAKPQTKCNNLLAAVENIMAEGE